MAKAMSSSAIRPIFAGRLSTAQVQLGQPASQPGVEHDVLDQQQVVIAEEIEHRGRTIPSREGVVFDFHHRQPAARCGHPIVVSGDFFLALDLLFQCLLEGHAAHTTGGATSGWSCLLPYSETMRSVIESPDVGIG